MQILAATTSVASNAASPPPPPPNPAHQNQSLIPPFSSNSKPSQILLPINRRALLTALPITLIPFSTSPQINNHYAHYSISLPVAGARGLFQMPPARLTNRLLIARPNYSFHYVCYQIAE